MIDGWVKSWRSIQSSWLWNKKPFDEYHAYADLKFTAQWEDKPRECRRGTTLQRGELWTTYRTLSDRWGWEKKRIMRFLRALQKDYYIQLKTFDGDRGGLHIRLCNYGDCQSDFGGNGTTVAPPKNDPAPSNGTANGTAKKTNNTYEGSPAITQNGIVNGTALHTGTLQKRDGNTKNKEVKKTTSLVTLGALTSKPSGLHKEDREWLIIKNLLIGWGWQGQLFTQLQAVFVAELNGDFRDVGAIKGLAAAQFVMQPNVRPTIQNPVGYVRTAIKGDNTPDQAFNAMKSQIYSALDNAGEEQPQSNS